MFKKKGYKKVAVIQGGLNEMIKSGFSFWHKKYGIVYKDSTGKMHRIRL